MSTPLKVILMLVAWFVYSLLAYQGCVKQCCEDAGTAIAPPPDSAVTRYPIDFKWADATANLNPGYEALRNQIVGGMKDGNILEITGLYYESEAAPPGYDNMGFARADQIKKAFAGLIPDDRIQLRARALEDMESARQGFFEASSFEWKEPEPKKAKEASEVEQLADRTIIRFPFNSDQKLVDPVVDEYINKLAKRLSQTTEKVRLTGHTDNVGEPAYNERLGRLRAEAIKAILVKNGIAADRVVVDSKGETQPEASNDTEEGRQVNRRVELRIVK